MKEETEARDWVLSWMPEAFEIDPKPGFVSFKLPGLEKDLVCWPNDDGPAVVIGLSDLPAWNRLYAGRPVPAWEAE